MIKYFTLLLPLAVSMILAQTPEPSGENWEHFSGTDGVEVFLRNDTAGTTSVFATASLQIKADDIALLLDNPTKFPAWMSEMSVSEVTEAGHIYLALLTYEPTNTATRYDISAVYITDARTKGLFIGQLEGIGAWEPEQISHSPMKSFRSVVTLDHRDRSIPPVLTLEISIDFGDGTTQEETRESVYEFAVSSIDNLKMALASKPGWMVSR